MTNDTAALGARLGLAGTLEFRDKDGAILKAVDFAGSVPLGETGMSVDQAQELITNQQEPQHGTDVHE